MTNHLHTFYKLSREIKNKPVGNALSADVKVTICVVHKILTRQTAMIPNQLFIVTYLVYLMCIFIRNAF